MGSLYHLRLLCLCFLIVVSVLPAQDVGLQHRAVASEYVLGSGDQIIIRVADLEDLPDRPLTVDPTGLIDLPLAGRVQASGLTIPELKAELVSKFSKYISRPEVAINLAVSGSQPVSVIGEVNNPGVHQLDGTKRLLEVLSSSGGMKADAGPRVFVTREKKWGSITGAEKRVDPATGDMTVSFSLDALMASRTPEDNIVIFPNDVISVPRADMVYIVGDVKKAGGFMLSTHETVLLTQALTLAEGLGPDSAARNARHPTACSRWRRNAPSDPGGYRQNLRR